MNWGYVMIICLFLTQSLGQEVDELPRKDNMVSNYVKKVLGPIFDMISGQSLSIPEIDLGVDVGKISNVEAGILGGLTKEIDGRKSFGFSLKTNVTSLTVKGQYDLLHLDIPGLFPFFGKGDFQIVIELINFNMALDATYNAAEENFDIDLPVFVISAENSTVRLENLMNDPHLADFLNELISNLVPRVVTMLNKPLLTVLKPLISYYGNGIILCIKNHPFRVEECIQKLFETTDIIPSIFDIKITENRKILVKLR